MTDYVIQWSRFRSEISSCMRFRSVVGHGEYCLGFPLWDREAALWQVPSGARGREARAPFERNYSP
jgi:hypothetical protein